LAIPILGDLAPNGFRYGGHYIVRFDPHSLWYETSLTIAALALRKGIKTEYHVFQHFPKEAIEAFSRLGINADEMRKSGMLRIPDDYTPTVEYSTAALSGEGAEQRRDRPLDIRKNAAYWIQGAKAGWSEQQKRWLHIDDNTAIFFQYNEEETMVDAWRTAIVPYGIRASERAAFHAFVNGVGSDEFFTKFGALCDGIIDLRAREENDRIQNYLRIRMLRGRTFDSRWHHLRILSNSEVRLDEPVKQSDLGVSGWLKGSTRE
jgi:KaiC/GvpD/RAD55 family RecA-like ATPase